MNFHKIEIGSTVNGEGVRTVLWVSGCNHRCKGCHNPQTWDEKSGNPFTEEDKEKLFKSVEDEFVSGITLSGGDPLYPSNRSVISDLVKEFKEKYPNKTIWLYTGYEIKELVNMNDFSFIDIDTVVCGKFDIDKKDSNYHWAGSTNQSLVAGQYVEMLKLWKNDARDLFNSSAYSPMGPYII